MTIQIALPPIPAIPAANASKAVWDAYLEIVKLHRQIDREDAWDAETARHHSALELAANRQAIAFEAQANSTGSLVQYDTSAASRRYAAHVISAAVAIFVDRTTGSTSVASRQKFIADSVADAKAIVDSVAATNPL